MVSHIEHPDQLVPQPPQSLSSRPSLSRRYRSVRRSSTPVPEPLSPNEFPVFSQTGDVEIIVTSSDGLQKQRYLLHRLILAQCSGFFDSDIKSDGSIAPPVEEPPYVSLLRHNVTATSRRSVGSVYTTPSRRCSGSWLPACFLDRKCWHYSLGPTNISSTRPRMLSQRKTWPTATGTPCLSAPVSDNKPLPSIPPGEANVSAPNLSPNPPTPSSSCTELCRDYDNLFRIFYNFPPELDTTTLTTAYRQCKSLLHLADAYDALEVVGPRIDHHLLQFQARLFHQIAKYPSSYLKLAYLARSKVIFAEALIHVVGQWPLAAPQLRDQIDESVIHLIEDKADDLDDLKCRIDSRLFRLALTTSRGEQVTPATSYLDWLATSLFRQWIVEASTPAPAPVVHKHISSVDMRSSSRDSNSKKNHKPAPLSLRANHHPVCHTSPAQTANTDHIYHILSSSHPSAYLPREDLKRFLKLTPELYSRDNMARFVQRFEELKGLAREVVGPVVGSCLVYDGVGGGAVDGEGLGLGLRLGYLTCTKVREEDYPWD